MSETRRLDGGQARFLEVLTGIADDPQAARWLIPRAGKDGLPVILVTAGNQGVDVRTEGDTLLALVGFRYHPT